MKRTDINYSITILLLISIVITASTGYIQSQLELRKFIPHRYFAYTTLILAALHIAINAGKLLRYIRQRFKKPLP